MNFEDLPSSPPDPRRRKRSVETGMDRLPPHAPEEEKAMLGCCLMDPVGALNTCIAKFGPAEQGVLYDLRHQSIYKAMLEMNAVAAPIDVITLQRHLSDQQMLEQVGGTTYIVTLPDSVPSVANLPYYLDIIAEKYLLRQLVRECTETVGKIYEGEGDAEAIVDDAERRILGVRQFTRFDVTQTIKDSVKRAINVIEDMHVNQGRLFGISTGLTDLDRATAGLRPGEMIVLAARPSVGKTSLAMNIVESVAIGQKLPVGVFSLETTQDALVLRMLASLARVNMRHIQDGFLTDRDFPKITGAAGKLSAAPIHIDDTSGLTAMELRARARRMYQQYGIRLLVIDYLQLLRAMINGRRIDKREPEVAEISSCIKQLAKELHVPVIVLSQLNRLVERERRRPTLADLRESGSIEQDADQVWMLYKKRREDDDDSENQDATPVDLLIAKQKDGPANVEINLTFLKAFTRFESAARITDDDSEQSSRLPHMDA